MRRSIVGLAVIGLVYAAPATGQNLLLNGGFETPIVTGGIDSFGTGANIGGWIVGSGDVETLPNTWQPAEGNQSLDLNGVSVGSIYQDILTTAGYQYDLQFALAGNPFRGGIKTLSVYWGASGGGLANVGNFSFDTFGYTQFSMGWVQESILGMTATSASSRVLFQSTTFATPDGGNFLDDIRLHEVEQPPVGTVTPEPVTMTLLGTGMVGVAAARRRRRQ